MAQPIEFKCRLLERWAGRESEQLGYKDLKCLSLAGDRAGGRAGVTNERKQERNQRAREEEEEDVELKATAP